MRALLFLTAVLVSEAPASVPAAEDVGRGRVGPEVDLMTFNIRYGTADDGDDRWEKRWPLVVDVLRRHRPDVVGLQEALRFQLDRIREALPEYAEVGVGRDDGKQAGEYAAILWRKDRFRLEEHGTFWLSETPDVPGSRSWGNTIPRICTFAHLVAATGGRGLWVYNVHLDHISQPSREKGVELLLRKVGERPDGDPRIVMGDFNAGEDNPAVLRLTGRPGPGADAPAPFLDTYRRVHEKAVDVGTFHSFRGGKTGPKIDHILVSPGVETLDAAILHDAEGGRFPSDHYPVRTRIRLPRPDPAERKDG